MRICVIEDPAGVDTLLHHLGHIAPGNWKMAAYCPETDLLAYDLLIIGQGSIDYLAEIQDIRDFVHGGGICWIMHQHTIPYRHWLPDPNEPLTLELKYKQLRRGVEHYVAPWIVDRDHAVWNSPNYIDEGRFVCWDFVVKNKRYRTAATHVLWQQDWKVLARFSDHEISPEEQVALVAERKYGRGLYLWTQIQMPVPILPDPYAFRSSERQYIRQSWAMMIDNLDTYFKNYRSGSAPDLPVKLATDHWAVMGGEMVQITVSIPPTAKAERISITAWLSDHIAYETHLPAESVPVQGHIRHLFPFAPRQGGTYRIEAVIQLHDAAPQIRNKFIKVTDRWTPFRFTTHTHFSCASAPDSPGVLFGLARRLGIDGIILAGERTTPAELKIVDHPAVRFFMGQEFHCGHDTEDQGANPADCPPDNPDFREHTTTFGHDDYIDYNKDKQIPENLVNVHQAKGLAIVAHPYMNRWWLRDQNGHHFEAVEFDRLDTRIWDQLLTKGDFVTGVSGADNLGHFWFSQRSANIGWFDRPFGRDSLFRTILAGRVTKMNSYPLPLEGIGSTLWFDICHQIVGGTVYAANEIKLTIRYTSHLPVQQVWVVKGGDRGHCGNTATHFEPDIEELDYSFDEPVSEDTYYRLEINHEKYYAPYCVTSLSNPIFVKKVPGPQNGYFYTLNENKSRFCAQRLRWIADATEVHQTRFEEKKWFINLYEPGERGSIQIGWKDARNVTLDGQTEACKKDRNGDLFIIFGHGNHTITVS